MVSRRALPFSSFRLHPAAFDMIDTHCHLTDPRLGSQLEDVLARARAAGVTRFITIGTGLGDDEAAIALCRGRHDVR